MFLAKFERVREDVLIWNMRVVLDRTRDSDSQVYNFEYQIPKIGMDLTMIAAIGLKYFQLFLKEEVQKKVDIDFIIGKITGGMIG